jgi:hypothetical protein
MSLSARLATWLCVCATDLLMTTNVTLKRSQSNKQYQLILAQRRNEAFSSVVAPLNRRRNEFCYKICKHRKGQLCNLKIRATMLLRMKTTPKPLSSTLKQS